MRTFAAAMKALFLISLITTITSADNAMEQQLPAVTISALKEQVPVGKVASAVSVISAESMQKDGIRNLFLVGDSDQSIYGWRGARNRVSDWVETLGCKVHRFSLTLNYRSSGCPARRRFPGPGPTRSGSRGGWRVSQSRSRRRRGRRLPSRRCRRG